MTLKQFKDMVADLPDDTLIVYHSYYKGCGYTPYSHGLNYTGVVNGEKKIILNPGDDYDERH